jgi:phosphate-induced protein 1
MRNALGRSLAICMFVIFGLAGAAYAGADDSGPSQVAEPGPPGVIHPINRHGLGLTAPTGSNSPSSNPISYHGGPVINTPAIYLIWYGNWNRSSGSDTPSGQQIVRDFAASIGGSPYFSMNTSYSNLAYNAIVSGGATFANEATDAYSRGSRLRDADVLKVVTGAISANALPYDANGVYFVLTSSDVTEQSGFCTRYCGWHTATSSSVGRIRYSFVGNANRCLNACAIQSTGPNGNAGVDAMVSVIAHELDEATTDPDLNAWYDSSGQENADKCAWTFGHFQYQVNGAWANVHLGSRDYLIQRNLDHGLNGGDYCMMDATHN